MAVNHLIVNCDITGQAFVTDHAVAYKSSLADYSVVEGKAVVLHSSVAGDCHVSDYARVIVSSLVEDVHVCGCAVVRGCSLRGTIVIGDSAIVASVSLKGDNLVIGADALIESVARIKTVEQDIAFFPSQRGTLLVSAPDYGTSDCTVALLSEEWQMPGLVKVADRLVRKWGVTYG